MTFNFGEEAIQDYHAGLYAPNNDIPQQHFGVVMLYARGVNSTGGTNYGNNDIRWLYDTEVASRLGDIPTAQAAAKNLNKSMQFLSGVVDMTITNSNVVDSTQQVGPDQFDLRRIMHLEVDVYELTCNEDGDGRYNNFTFAQQDVLLRNNMYGSSNYADLNTRGVTPFENQSMLKALNARILKKTKYLLGPGQSFTYQYRDPRNHTINTDHFVTNGFNIRGVTKYIVVVSKPIYNWTGIPGQRLRFGLSYGVTRKYRFTLQNQDISGSGFLRKA